MRSPAWILAVGVWLIACVGAGPLAAADEPTKWEFEVVPYLWIFGASGTLEVRGRTAVVDTTVYDTLHLVFDGDALAAGGYFSAARGRWSVFVDAFGGYARDSVNEKVPTRFCTLCVAAKADLRNVFLDVALGYRLGEWSIAGRRRPVSLGVYAGTRYMHFGTELRPTASVVGGIQRSGYVSEVYDWADPMIGVRWEVPLLDRLSLDFRGDIGGFGVSSKLIWGLVAGIRWWLPWTPLSTQPWLAFGYRAIAFDREFGSSNDLELQVRGPTIGVGFAF